jgi:peptidoglycan/xylan/chitin deacetylase (PgdA/CDA1 family)
MFRTMVGVSLVAAALLCGPQLAPAADSTPLHRRMAVTIDDLPQSSRIQTVEHRLALNERLLRTLVDEKIPAVGFVNAGKCSADGQLQEHQRDILQAWVDAGLELGNHTWSHVNYHRVELDAYARDVERGEPLLRELLAESSERPLHWFRHPYLFRGDTDAKREALEAYLRERGYDEAPVSIDNAEWVYAAAYDNELLAGDADGAERIGRDYVRYMLEMVRFWEGQSLQLFDRNIDHVLLIHGNTLNADHLDELVARLRELGYEFITLAEALEDPAYRSEDRYTGRAGISWLHRWAITRGVDRTMFAGEPTVPEWVGHIADVSGY